MTTVYLVRHAKSIGNTERIFQGRSNFRIVGRRPGAVAGELAERFRNIPLEAVYSSPLQRAVQTAEAVSHYHHLPIQTEEDLKRNLRWGVGVEETFFRFTDTISRALASLV